MYFASKHTGCGSCQNSTVSCPCEFVQLAPMRKREKRCSTQEYHLFQFDISIRILIIPVLFSNSYKSTSPFSTQPDPIPSNTTSGSCGHQRCLQANLQGSPSFCARRPSTSWWPFWDLDVLLMFCFILGDGADPKEILRFRIKSFSPWLAQTLYSRAKWHYHSLSMFELFELVRFDNLSIFGICFFFFNKLIWKCQILKNTIYIYLKLCLAWSVLKVLLAWVRVSRFETDCHITPKGGHTSSLLSDWKPIQPSASHTFEWNIYNLSACRCWLISICVSLLGFLVWYVAKVCKSCKDAWKMCLPQFISLNSYSISFQAVCEYF